MPDTTIDRECEKTDQFMQTYLAQNGRNAAPAPAPAATPGEADADTFMQSLVNQIHGRGGVPAARQ